MEWQRWGLPAMETGRAGRGPWKQILRQSPLCKRFISKVCPAFHCVRISEDASPQDLPDTAGGVQIDATTLENNLAVSHGGEYSAIPLPDACLETTSSSLVSDVCSLMGDSWSGCQASLAIAAPVAAPVSSTLTLSQ
ncbi:uncharacterized protein LOC130541057 [Pan paniscus]|uniref:uncharacterized protein LOC130541057 n=1 Tax=Pan paniscus TaxID=9597 RepID=UPI0025464405|nr:uncharacterized protein LOC130541057 [Pan paniscus]